MSGALTNGAPDADRPPTLTPDAFRLDGRTAVVTGAARGLGEAIARSFAQFGAELAMCDRNADGLSTVADDLRSQGVAVTTAVLDVRDADTVREWIDGLPGAVSNKRIDVVVNNAGGTFHSPFLEVSDRGRQSLVDENFTSVALVTSACVPHMTEGGSIINVTSVEAYRAAPGFAVYGAMKAAVEHLTRSLALELSDRGIRVNSLAPDALPTPGDADLLVGDDDYGAKLALGWGAPDDICGAAVFLASSASRFVTGTTIHVDGGSDAARGWRKTPAGWWP
ncbi:MAG: SDR family oxidoreductase [Ilumatobacter sp.]|nr:MAG: SDR family oxidoreductase [Ilumatobacter sp.]